MNVPVFRLLETGNLKLETALTNFDPRRTTRAGLTSNARFVLSRTDHWPVLLNRLALHLNWHVAVFVRHLLLMRAQTPHLFHADVLANVHHIRRCGGFLLTK